MEQLCIVITTTNTIELAQNIASALIAAQIAACIQIDKTQSMYMWQGVLEQHDEFRLTIKTLDQYYDKICLLIKKMHTYNIPEIIKLRIADIDSQYLSWILATLEV